MSKKLIEDMFDDYEKMQILRNVAKTIPGSQLYEAIKSLDRQWDKHIKNLQPPKKKKSFVTKF